MPEDRTLPKIITVFDEHIHGTNNSSLYKVVIQNTLRKTLPVQFFSYTGEERENREDQHEYLNSILPYTTYTPCETVPTNISFFSIAKYRASAFKFFYEMISRWLVPGKRMNVLLMYAADFSFPELSRDIYTVCEVMIQVQTQEDLEVLQHHLPIIQTEINLGVRSAYYARRILEIQGLSSDEKTALIQEHITSLIDRLPRHFDYDVFTEMQHVLVICRDDFKAAREIRHLSRIISIQYLFRKDLRAAVKKAPEKRYLRLKLFKANLHQGSEKKKVLAIIVGVNFLREKEIFEQSHLLKAIQNYIPQAKSVENSFFANQKVQENICTLYLEIEKSNDEEFTAEEMSDLRRELPTDLEGRIEHLMHPVFMPRNEEEIMRNILSLSNQIKYLRDIPQVFISFDEQTHRDIYFTIILVRVVKAKSISIWEMFRNSNTLLAYIHDRCKTVGYIRKKNKKEATVFRVKLRKDQFLRRDHSIDLNKARQAVVDELTSIMGEFRDFNGGMISKQNEMLCSLRGLLKNTVKYNDLLLENFFYSLNPVIMRTVLEPESLKKLFLMLLDAISEGFFKEESYSMKIEKESDFVYVMIAAESGQIEEAVSRKIGSFQIQSAVLASSCVHVYDTPYLGYVYRCDDPIKQHQFCKLIQNTVGESIRNCK